MSNKSSAKKYICVKVKQNVMIHTEILDHALDFPGTRAYLI